MTPELEFEKRYTRFKEINEYLDTHGLRDEPWIAVDDSPELFPPNAPLLLTRADSGFNGECALRLRQMILALREDS